MKVYETLPPISPRAGFLRAVSAWKDAALVEFGPEGTMHYAQSAIHGETSNLFTTGMEERQIIYGETQNLEAAVQEADRLLSPKVIFITSSPVSEIIGTDLQQVCRKLQSKVQGRLVCWDQVPMEGREEYGQRKAYELAAGFLTRHGGASVRNRQAQKRFLVLGLGESDWNGKADLNEIRRMMQSFLGLECLNDADGRYHLTDIAAADWILAAVPEAVPLAKAAEALWHIPWYEGMPYGICGSDHMLASAEQALEICRSSQWNTERQEAERMLTAFQNSMRHFHHTIWVDTRKSRADALIPFLVQEAKLAAAVPKRGTAAFSTDGTVNLLPEMGPDDGLIGCGAACSLYPGRSVLCMDEPALQQQLFSSHIPCMGIRGAMNLLTALHACITK